MRAVAAIVALVTLAVVVSLLPRNHRGQGLLYTPDCRPVDGAWAVAVHVTDAVTNRPVTDAVGMLGRLSLDYAVSDSSGWLCIRTLPAGRETLQVSRPGYRDATLAVAGEREQVVTRELRFQRVPDPCCDLRGRWRITFHLDSAGEIGPRPTARTVTGELELGPRIIAPEEGDLLDSLVRVVRGLHEVDFRPFFGGPVAQDVSTSIFGDGPDLLREVMASVPSADSVTITFIPRMSHGSLSLDGRIRADTIRGAWVQNAYCCGATGRFVMTRIGSPDTTPFPRPAVAADGRRARQAGPPPAMTRGGQVPGGRWRPELAVAPDGRLWLARGGLFVADSLFGPWRRALGGPTDPVEADELRIGVRLAFVGGDTVLLGMDARYPMVDAPVLYQTENAGLTWASVPLPNITDVRALSAVGRSVWLAGSREDGVIALLETRDGGRTWGELAAPALRDTVSGLGLLRLSDSLAYLFAGTDPGEPGLWRTTDGGRTWLPLPTPSDQGLQRLEPWETRIEEMATVGPWILVREHGRVFVSPAAEVRWRTLPDVRHIASEAGGSHVFALRESLHAALLDADLDVVWQSAHPLPLRDPSDVEQVLVRDGIGYVSETRGAVHEVWNGSARVLGRSP